MLTSLRHQLFPLVQVVDPLYQMYPESYRENGMQRRDGQATRRSGHGPGLRRQDNDIDGQSPWLSGEGPRPR